MEVLRSYKLPEGTRWDKIEHYVDVEKLERMLLNKFRDPNRHEPKYAVRNTLTPLGRR